MKKPIFLIAVLLLFGVNLLPAQIIIGNQQVDTTTVAKNLYVPWEMIWDPDNFIWFTQRNGKVSRFDPVNKTIKVILQIPDVTQQSESGLLGMALHPNFKDSSYVYLVYNYLSNNQIKERLVRYTYTPDTLTNQVILLDNLGGSNNHNGSRLIITPDRKIMMSTGDTQNPSVAQNNSNLSGKILRLNLDGTVPADNPIPGNLLWTKGHRNPQGLVLAPNGILYSSEHGPDNDDEFNIIKKGRNYGWPTVEGFCNTSTEIQFCNDSNVVEPLEAWTPTLAVAGIDYYNSTAIQEWNKCILMVTLKESDLRELTFNSSGDSITKTTIYFDRWFGRLRDVCMAPNGDVYICTSNRDGRASSPFPKPIDDRIIKISLANNSGIQTINTEMKEVKITPNPITDQCKIVISNAKDAVYNFMVYNLVGEEVKQIQINGNTPAIFHKEGMPNGMYMYKVTYKNALVASGKMIFN